MVVFLHPRREEWHKEVEADEHVEIPHVCGVAVERERYHGYVTHRIAPLLRGCKLKGEEHRDYALVQADDARKPRYEVVNNRPEEHRDEDARNAATIER